VTTEVIAATDRFPAPQWVSPSLRVDKGEDPLGLQSTTQDRLMPLLAPGILELSERARYLSFYAFLLDEYRRERRRTDTAALSSYIKQKEWDLGLAVRRCPRHCGSSPVGAQRLGAWVQGQGPFERGESVQSPLGGYGLYYRSPLSEIGIVAKAGTLLGDEPIPIDVLYDTERARRMADTFRDAVVGTQYYARAMRTSEPMSADVVDELAEVACLCRLQDFAAERDAVQDALFGSDADAELAPAQGAAIEAGLLQRRRTVGHYLTLIETDPAVVKSRSAYRDAQWGTVASHGPGHEVVAGQWAAVVAKDVWQEALCSVWTSFCRTGVDQTHQLGRGLSWDEVRWLASAMVEGPPTLDQDDPTAELAAALEAGRLPLTGPEGLELDVTALSMDELRRYTREFDTATSGVVVLLELARRVRTRTGEGWVQGVRQRSRWQPSLAEVMADLDEHLVGSPTIGDTLWWLVSRFIMPVHERIAYSKLPVSSFTFRFRWEDGLLRFYDLGLERFILAATRFSSLASLTRDLGFWEPTGSDGAAEVTEAGTRFIYEAFS
jgi:hypothetical protein